MGSHFTEEQAEAWRNGAGVLLSQLHITSKTEKGFQRLGFGVSGFWMSPPGSGRTRSPAARAAGGALSPPEGPNALGGPLGKGGPAPQQRLGRGRGTGRKFPICSAPILASPFVPLAICPAAPRAPRSHRTRHKYQDGLCLHFQRQRGPAPQPCRAPSPAAAPSPPQQQLLPALRLLGAGTGTGGLSEPSSSLLGGLGLWGTGSASLFSLLLPQRVFGSVLRGGASP